ncbi:MAG: hypothetical protein FWD60_00970 [Candidatus Azobacteroides sp.]|nr:hypothetical protein [Candidatus Azobacteroides sp.]
MSTATIISNIRKLPLAEQHFVVEQVMKSIRNAEQKQTGFAEIPEGYMTSEEFRRRATIKVNQFCDKHGIL